jgi:hypothetical protein
LRAEEDVAGVGGSGDFDLAGGKAEGAEVGV